MRSNKNLDMYSNQVKNSLTHYGFAHIEYPLTVQKNVEHLALSMKDFFKQSFDHKQSIECTTDGGYEYNDKITNLSLADHKEVFHITKRYEYSNGLIQTAEDATFIYAGKLVLAEIIPLIKEVGRMLSDITGADFVKLMTKSMDGLVLRCLYYPPQMPKNGIIAAEHLDKSGNSFGLYDSTPGFQAFWDGQWSDVLFSQKQMIFYPSMLAQYYSNCILKALLHRVRITPVSRMNGRYSIVLFNDYATADVVYDKVTHGPT
jgi:isopenicillin N synthase-like dioxygenase